MKGDLINLNHVKIDIMGYVQGVGFRPFLYRLARQHKQNGWVLNTPEGVTIALEGKATLQQTFINHLQNRLPPFAEISSMSVEQQPLRGYSDFQILPSQATGRNSAFVLPDIASCPDCVHDINNPDSRFHRYPFTSCSVCGPRYSIMRSQPYDRANTSMAGFGLCGDCARDYQNIENRRFHAQTIACPVCGPQLALSDADGNVIAEKNAALDAAAGQLRAGKILALKGIGGYQLLVDACNHAAVERLRQRKQRPHKPFAMLADWATAQSICHINELERVALQSPAAPIVLLNRKQHPPQFISDAVAPDNRLLGMMLPYSPLHHLLSSDFGGPLVATSGNRQDEPICTDERQALTSLSGIADYFLSHNRPILRPLDDSIVRLIDGKMTVLRRARGYAPMPVKVSKALLDGMALGGQLKNTVAVNVGKQIILSQHLGDLTSRAAREIYQQTLAVMPAFYQIKPGKIMHDLHKDYVSSQLADQFGGQQHAIQHHYAHALSCMAEHDLLPPCLAVVWDGTGLGRDKNLWGGEFLLIEHQGFKRYAHFRYFGLPGGTKAIQEPRRAALGLLYVMDGELAFPQTALPFAADEFTLLKAALQQQLNCPRTSSAGRLFDAVASLLGLCHVNQYEGQAAMLLEQSASSAIGNDQFYPFEIYKGDPVTVDWQQMIQAILAEIPSSSREIIAAKFHNTLAEIAVKIAGLAGQECVVLSGGCFQNAFLVEKSVSKLKCAGFKVYCHERIPPNDGGLALGQLYAAGFLR